MPKIDPETIGPVLGGTARAWRLKLDERLKPMGLSQAKWRTLLHLSVAPGPLTQAEIAARLGIEEPTLVTLLHRLESGGWVTRRSSSYDRRCKMVHLGRRARRVIAQLLADIPASQLRTCISVLVRIRDRAEKSDRAYRRGMATSQFRLERNGQDKRGNAITKGELASGPAESNK
jgi:MarR family transcriptional regulator for hemolysin